MSSQDLKLAQREIDSLASAWPKEFRLGYRFGFQGKADPPCDRAGYPGGSTAGRSIAATRGGAGGIKGAPPSKKPLREKTAMDRAPLLKPEEIAAAVGAEKAKRGRAGEKPQRQRSTSANNRDVGVRLEDFVAYMQTHDYIFKPAGDFWPAARVNARLPKVKVFDGSGQPIMDEDTGEQREIQPSVWLARHAAVEQMTWAPGLPQLIEDKLISEGGWIDRKGVTVFNLYRPPRPPHGDEAKAGRWIELVKKIYPDDADHIVMYCAHRVQKPHEKINHGLLLIGVPGIGKDTMLEPVKLAVGPWNFAEVSPPQVLGRFNGFLKSVVLRISEVTDMPEYDRYKFYSHMKTILAAPPDTLRVDEKNLREHCVVNVCGVIMTTNEKTGVYLPADDRRNYVAKSEVKPADFVDGYWPRFWGWYGSGGLGHVAAYLSELDISNFDPKAPPPKTAAFWTIVDANRPRKTPTLLTPSTSLRDWKPGDRAGTMDRSRPPRGQRR